MNFSVKHHIREEVVVQWQQREVWLYTTSLIRDIGPHNQTELF